MNLFDLGVLTIIGLSALMSFYRGLIREILSLGGWLVASFVTLRFLEPATHLVRPQIKSELVASGVAAIGLFFITLILFTVLVGTLVKFLKPGDKVGLLDNLGGLSFGIARGALIVGIGFFIMTKFFTDEKKYPALVQQAVSRPYVALCAKWIGTLAPGYLDKAIGKDKPDSTAKDDLHDARKNMDAFIRKIDDGAKDAQQSLEKKIDDAQDSKPASSLPSMEDLQKRIREENEKK